jgi:hypothetical protein
LLGVIVVIPFEFECPIVLLPSRVSVQVFMVKLSDWTVCPSLKAPTAGQAEATKQINMENVK